MRILINDHNASYHWHYHAKDKSPEVSYLRTLREIISRFKVDKVINLQDGGYAYRTSIYPEYKTQRQERREKQSEADQKAYANFRKNAYKFAKDILPLFGMTTLRVQNSEADDLGAFLVKHIDKSQHQILLLSSDKDWHQNLQHNVVQASYTDIQNALKSQSSIPGSVWLSESGFEKKYDLKVAQWIWVKALQGDTGDNVKGVAPGLGEGAATKLMQTYGSIQGIKDHIDNLEIPRMTAKAKEGLKENWETLYLNYQVMNLRHTADEELDILGQDGIEYLKDTIENLPFLGTMDETAIQELCYENGWLDLVEDNFLDPYKKLLTSR